MNKMLLAAAFAAASTMIIAAPASAAVVLDFSPGGHSATPGYTIVDDFSSLAGLSNISGGVEIHAPGSDGDGAQPANSLPSGTSYLSVLSGGSASYNFAAPVHGFEFDWGSIDTFNTLTINSSTGQITVIPGGALFPNAANGDQQAPGTNGLFQVIGNAGETFSGVTFSSSGNAFELDNLAVAAVPEPGVWAMMIIGLGGMGMLLRRRRNVLALQTA